MSDLVPAPRGWLARRSQAVQQRRIDESADIACYRSDRLVEIQDHKRANIDYFSARRMAGAELLVTQAEHILARHPGAEGMINAALIDREMGVSLLARALVR